MGDGANQQEQGAARTELEKVTGGPSGGRVVPAPASQDVPSTRPSPPAPDGEDPEVLKRRVADLQAQLAAREARPMGMAREVSDAKWVLVENSSERMHGINDGQPPGAKGVRVRKPYINLWPGLNKVEAADWAKALKEPMVQLYLKDRTFAERARINSYEDLAERDAVALLSNAWEPNLLKDWQGKDARANVQEAIRKQWDQINGERANPDKPAQRTTMKSFAARMAGNG